MKPLPILPLGIADSSPIISLARIGQAQLLDGHFDRLIAPQTVAGEVGPLPPFIIVLPDLEPNPHHPFPADIDPGEAQVLLHGFVNPVSTLLLDDLAARTYAEQSGLEVMGTIGIVLRSKRQRRVERVRPLLMQLREAGMFSSDALLARALHLAGEAP